MAFAVGCIRGLFVGVVVFVHRQRAVRREADVSQRLVSNCFKFAKPFPFCKLNTDFLGGFFQFMKLGDF